MRLWEGEWVGRGKREGELAEGSAVNKTGPKGIGGGGIMGQEEKIEEAGKK